MDSQNETKIIIGEKREINLLEGLKAESLGKIIEIAPQAVYCQCSETAVNSLTNKLSIMLYTISLKQVRAKEFPRMLFLHHAKSRLHGATSVSLGASISQCTALAWQAQGEHEMLTLGIFCSRTMAPFVITLRTKRSELPKPQQGRAVQPTHSADGIHAKERRFPLNLFLCLLSASYG